MNIFGDNSAYTNVPIYLTKNSPPQISAAIKTELVSKPFSI